LIGFNHRAASQDEATENSDHPHSRHIVIVGAGLIGGALTVRAPFR
jgi:hypothetical protein